MRYLKRAGRTAVIMGLLLACAFPSYGTKTDVNTAKDKMTTLEEEKKRTEQTIKDLESLKADTAAYVKKLDGSLESLNQELNHLAVQITDKEADIAVTQEELSRARQTEERQYSSMKLRIKYMYEKGDSSFLDLLMDSKSMAELLNRTEYISKISEYDRNMLNEYAAVKEDISRKEAALEGEHQTLLALKESTQAKQASVEQLMKEKALELKNYESKITAAQGQLDEYQRDIKAQEDKIKQIEAEIRRKEEEARKKAEAEGQKYNTVNIGNIKFIWPCPASSKITSKFGEREAPTQGASTNHQAIDVSAPTGTDIIAAASGEVTISTYSYSAGNYIMINHGGGVSTVYMHCSNLLVKAGETVKQGQVIARVGSTGYSTGPHLHFGVRVNGSYVNPLKHVSP